MKLYFSHPTVTYKTKTESNCLEIIHDALEPEEILNPSDYGLKDDLQEVIKEAEAIVGMAVSGSYTFLVWNEMEFGDSLDLTLYTLMVRNKSSIGPLVKGMPDDIEKLSKAESERFSREITTEAHRESFFSFLLGNWGRRF